MPKDPPIPLSSKRKLDKGPDDPAKPPPAKTQATYIRHPIHWAQDGNVLLQFGKTRFKVHQSRLSTQSVWFSELFTARRDGFLKEGYQFGDVEDFAKRVEVVDNLDLFNLENGYISSEEFAVLLTAMDDAIQYTHDKPAFDLVQSILIVATHYHFDKFAKFARQSITALFPADVEKITSSPILNSIEAINLGWKYNIQAILRPAFYQLAREKPEILELHPLKRLSQRNLGILINLQKELTLFWDDISDVVRHDCRDLKCVMSHTQHLHTYKKMYPLDPIVGMEKLIEHDWSTKSYCLVASKDIVPGLEIRRRTLWDNMKTWLGLENLDGDDSDDDDSDDDSDRGCNMDDN